MEINDIHKYCHVSTFISYGNSTPVYKQTFKFKLVRVFQLWQNSSEYKKYNQLGPMSVIPTPQGVCVWLPPAIGSCSPGQGQTHTLVRPDCSLLHGAMMTDSLSILTSSVTWHSSQLSNSFSLVKKISVYTPLLGAPLFCQGLSGAPCCLSFNSRPSFFLWGSLQPYNILTRY